MAERRGEAATAPDGGVDTRQDTVAIPRTPAADVPSTGTSSSGTAPSGAHVASNGSGRSASAGPSATAPAARTASTQPTATATTGTATPSTPTRKPAATAAPGARKARLRLTRIDPWSVMKTAFLLSIALGIVIVVSVLMVWTVLGAADVWQSIDNTVRDIVGGQDASDFDIQDYIGTRRVVGFTMVVAAADVVLVTAIATLGAFLYNMSASLLGGIEVTLAEDS